MPAKHIPMAIAYDFDKTLSPINMQEHEFLKSIGIDKSKFWRNVKTAAKENNADEILCYMNEMSREASYHKAPVNKKAMRDYGKGMPLFPGVEDWFQNINSYAKSKQVNLTHYIISSGIKSIIEGSSISKNFERVFACDFIYDSDGKPTMPSVAINYTTKTQYLFRINKGCLNLYDDKINDYVPMDERPIPFENIVFIGDGPTDIPAMKMTNYQGGISIAVYPPKKNSKTAKKLVEQGRATFMAPADYSPNKKIEQIVKARIDEIVAKNILKNLKS